MHAYCDMHTRTFNTYYIQSLTHTYTLSTQHLLCSLFPRPPALIFACNNKSWEMEGGGLGTKLAYCVHTHTHTNVPAAEAIHLATMLSKHGFFFCVEGLETPMRDDGTLFRFQVSTSYMYLIIANIPNCIVLLSFCNIT